MEWLEINDSIMPLLFRICNYFIFSQTVCFFLSLCDHTAVRKSVVKHPENLIIGDMTKVIKSLPSFFFAIHHCDWV